MAKGICRASGKGLVIILLQCAGLLSFGLPVRRADLSGPAFAVAPLAAFRITDTVPPERFDIYVSTRGSDSNSGITPTAPKSTFDGVLESLNNNAGAANSTSIGLEANSKFRDELDLTRQNIRVSGYGLDSGKRIPTITGMDPVRDWRRSEGRQQTFQSVITHSLDLVNPNYHYLFIAEIDTLKEKLFPVSAIRYLSLVSSIDQCEQTPGTFYLSPLNQNPATIYMHPSKGIPDSNGYRYEVIKRSFGINSFYYDEGTFENVFLQASGNGYGMLAAGYKTTVKNVIFQGGGTHHSVIQNGTVNRSLFLPGPKGVAAEIALVFYSAQGLGYTNKLTNSMFLDIPNSVFTHTNGTSNYRALVIDSVYAFADTLNRQTMLSSDNTDSVYISNSYGEGHKNFWVGFPSYLSITNSVINRSSEAAIQVDGLQDHPTTAIIHNTLINSNGNDVTQGQSWQQPSTGIRFGQPHTTVKFTNSIYNGRSTWHTQYATQTLFNNSVNNKLEARHNIYICDVNPENYMHIVSANNNGGKGTASNFASDSNVYVVLKGITYWTAYPYAPDGSGNIFTLRDWQQYSGQDQHSLFVDLRSNPAGLKAIFTDPDNGNWTLTNTPLADSIRKLQAGMLTPPLYYPLRTTYEDALDHTLPGGLSFFSARKENDMVHIAWKTIKEPNFLYFGVESSTDSLNFTRLANIPSRGRNRDNEYTLDINDSTTKKIFLRLRMMQTDSNFQLAPVVTIVPPRIPSLPAIDSSTGRMMILYPNPVESSVTVVHPARDKASLVVYDFTGKQLKLVPVQAGATTTSVSLPGLPSGKYVIRWTSGSENKGTSFIKVK